jgi:hypothetical protein
VNNWYEILGVSESITDAELEKLEEAAQREHHPDRYGSASPEIQAQHAAQLKRTLEGVSFLLTEKGRELLDKQLRQQRAAAEQEARRQQNEKEARERGDADDLRARFGGRPSTASGAQSGGGRAVSPPSLSRRMPQTSPRSPVVSGPSITAPPRILPELALFSLLVLATLAPLGVILGVATQDRNINHPDFGIAMLGFGCVCCFWIGVVATGIYFYAMSNRAKFFAVATLCASGLIVKGVVG